QLSYPFGALVKLLILTGQRRSEVAGMRWSEIKGDVWTLPADRTKSAKAHDVPLSRAALDILADLPRIGEDFVLTVAGRGSFRGYAKGKCRLDALLPPDMPPWVLHDLRRSVASGLARLGVNLPTIERLLNHSSGSFAGIVGVYQRHDFAAEKKQAAELWACHVLGLAQQTKQQQRPKRSNVVGAATVVAPPSGRCA